MTPISRDGFIESINPLTRFGLAELSMSIGQIPNRPRRLAGLVLLVSTAIAAGCARPEICREAHVASFTNVIVVMIDTLRSDYLSSYGSDRGSGATLSHLAAEGIQLQGYSVSSWTRPSVATFLTGLYPQRHQVLDRTDALGATTPYLPEILQAAGIQTAAMVTNGNVSGLFGFSRGFDLFRLEIGAGKPSTDRTIPWALELAEDLQPPFFYYIHLMDPHTPYLPDRIPERPNLTYRDYLQPQQLLAGEVDFNDENVQLLREQYLEEIREMDSELDKFLVGLERLGLLENTLLIITSDHGEEFNEHGGLAHGVTLFEEVLRVPMLLWASSGLDPYRSNDPVSSCGFHTHHLAGSRVACAGRRRRRVSLGVYFEQGN